MLAALAAALQAKWGHGVGRKARQMRGEMVSTGKDLRVRRADERADTSLCPYICPDVVLFLIGFLNF